ncbi:hypothetical protein SAMN04488132_102322 [Sediminibacterium ginsengisoli]|uniref:Methyltransferase domain-containing protein n=2 Tax=Sediminibacterium ginsengisoli TaxID=413434 RepID=A0A1T4L5X4_9BACT|nr:hypothetical protein SAMN04488132_102322 [Sediminibacterium ginsengisoli]
MKEILKRCADSLLFYPDDYGHIYGAVRELHKLYAPITGITAGVQGAGSDIYLPQGKAISPPHAAFCLLEGQRTSVFMRGIYQAILKLKTIYPSTRLTILYAGCGPYATLVTPLTTLFKAEEINIQMLDINPICLEAVKKLYTELGLSAYVGSYICEDATVYQAEIPPHLIISETMMHALVREPQVAIMLNLIPQLTPGGLFIPQEITVSATLLNFSQESKRCLDASFNPKRTSVGKIYTISQHNCQKHQPVTVRMPENFEETKELYLLTDIRVFNDQKLSINDCSLNIPVKVQSVEGYEGRDVTFEYIMGEKPAFRHHWS